MTMKPVAVLCAAASVLGSASAGNAQPRASENAVVQAEDAFGISVRSESLGLYSGRSVRGFSPTTAGNVRIDGLYFDQVAELGSDLRRTSAIRVGLSMFGFPFPAPTGVVDHQLRRPGATGRRSAVVSLDTQGGFIGEADIVVPLAGEKLSLGAGLGLYKSEYDNGTDSRQRAQGALLRWRPRDDLEVMPFVSRADMYDNDAGPNVVPVGSTLPPPMARRRFNGPDWINSDAASTNYGMVARWAPNAALTARAGLFRSVHAEDVGYSNLIVNVTPVGVGRQIISVDPPATAASTSGEVRLTYRFDEGPRLHQVHVSLRGRDRTRRSGGSTQYDLGLISLSAPQEAPEPSHIFSEQTREGVRQWIGGVAYEGRWRDRAEVSLGAQFTDYLKETREPGRPTAISKAGLLLWNAALAVNLSRTVVAYGGVTRGLEESGVAPAAAANRNAGLPALETEQADAGVRWRMKPGLGLIVGVFEVRKPYFNLDEHSVWRELGDVRNRGAEVSLSGEVRPGLTILAGAVLLDAVVTGAAVQRGQVGRRPVGSSPRTLLFSADWRPDKNERLSVNLGVSHSGAIVATRDNRARIPPRTTFDLGLRYRLRSGSDATTLRVQVRNITDEGGFSLRGSGAFGVASSRLASVSVTTDF